MTKPAGSKTEVRAKLFVNGRSQAVRLPKEFRFEGKEVRVRHAMGGVLLEPVERKRTSLSSLREWFAEMDALSDGQPFPQQQEQPPVEERDPIL